MLRIILIILAGLVLFRLVSALIRGLSHSASRSIPKRRGGKKVGEGRILDTKYNDDKKD